MNHNCGQEGCACDVCHCTPCKCGENKKKEECKWIETWLEVRKMMLTAMDESDLSKRESIMKEALQKEITLYEKSLIKN